MSGGSWSYLYSKEIDDLMQYSNIELLEEMVCQWDSIKRIIHWYSLTRIRS